MSVMIVRPSTGGPRRGASGATAVLRVIGVALVFVVTAAPLPGDTPGCDPPPGVDTSPALIGTPDQPDQPFRLLCAEHCYADCRVLRGCEGGYMGDAGYSACVMDCTVARACPSVTFDAWCPLDRYGEGRVITENERDDCIADAEAADCWCTGPDDCWAEGQPMPFTCTPDGLCDER